MNVEEKPKLNPKETIAVRREKRLILKPIISNVFNNRNTIIDQTRILNVLKELATVSRFT